MSTARCPECGRTTFTVSGWAAFDRCPRCGSALAETQAAGTPLALEREVRDRLYGEGRGWRRGLGEHPVGRNGSRTRAARARNALAGR